MRLKQPGQATSEYGLIMALVLMGAIGGLILLGTNIRDFAAGMLPAPKPAQAAIAAAPGLGGGGSDTAGNLAAGTTEGAVSGEALSLMTNGNVSAPDGPINVRDSVVTAGANGTAEELANTMEYMAKTLLENGEITPEQANAIMTMANGAHDVAAVAKIVEDMAASCGSSHACFDNTPVTFKGQTYANARELAKLAGWVDGSSPSVTDNTMQNALLSMYGKIPQEQYDTLYELAHTTSLVGEMVRYTTTRLQDYPEITPGMFHQSEVDQQATWLPDKPINVNVKAQHVADEKGATICVQQQGNTDSGSHCSSGG